MISIKIFGKEGCKKCSLLKDKVARVLKKINREDIQVDYHDVLQEKDLVLFCQMEELNPSSIPAFVLMQDGVKSIGAFTSEERSMDDGKYADSFLYTCVGMQTDYDKTGVIPDKCIEMCLKKVLSEK